MPFFSDILRRSTEAAYLPKRQEVVLWTSEGGNDGSDLFDTVNAITGRPDSVERHGGENNGAAQARLCPATGKYSSLPGLSWLKDVKAFGTMHSGHANDDDVGGGSAGKRVTHDYIKGGPYTRMEHIHVLDCAGYDYLKLYWTGKCLNYNGLDFDLAGTALSYATGELVNHAVADVMKIGAAGMPAVDSSDSMFSLPKLMRMNENDSLALEGGPYAFATITTTTFTAAADNVVTNTGTSGGVFNNGMQVTVTTSAADLPLGLAIDTTYYIVQANATGSTCKLSLTQGGVEIDIQDAGTGTHTMQLNYNGPGSGFPRGIPRMHGATNTGIKWEPDLWVQGGEPLWCQTRGLYPGSNTDYWTHYDQVFPALGFETEGGSPAIGNFLGVNGAPGVFQWGKVYKSVNDKLITKRWTQAGDRFEATCWLGYPTQAAQLAGAANGGAGMGTSFSVGNQGKPLLRITGLARIALGVGALGLSWHGGGLGGGIVMEQSTRAVNSAITANRNSSFLQSVPTGTGVVAPREHIRGRLIAVLTRE